MKRHTTQGVSLVETIIYVAVLTLLAGLVVTALLTMTRSYLHFRTNRELATAGETALERLTREIRLATTVDDTGSTLGTHPGRLTLNTTDAGGAVTTIEFSVSNGQLLVKEGSGTAVPLVSEHIEVTNLVFRKLTTSVSDAVKIELTLRNNRQADFPVVKFYDSIILRGGY